MELTGKFSLGEEIITDWLGAGNHMENHPPVFKRSYTERPGIFSLAGPLGGHRMRFRFLFRETESLKWGRVQ